LKQKCIFFTKGAKFETEVLLIRQLRILFFVMQNKNQLNTLNYDYMKRVFFTIGLGIAIFSANAQTTSPQLVSSAGESFKNTSYQLDWSIGELQTETYTAGSQMLTQGFHQNSYTVSTAVEQVKGLQFEITAFPNPTTDFISLKVESSKTESLQYTITDLSGRVLQTNKLLENNQQINFSGYAVGTYFITISQNSKLVKSFKIIKN